MRHNSTNKAKDGVELRKSRVDQRIGDDIVSLRDADDTVRANLALTDAGNHTCHTDGQAHAEAEQSADGAGSETAEHDEESRPMLLLFLNATPGQHNDSRNGNVCFCHFCAGDCKY